MTVSIFYVDIFGITFIKKVNILEKIKDQGEKDAIIRADIDDEKEFNFNEFKQQFDWLFASNFNRMIDNIEFTYQINNNLDICIRLRNKHKFG